MKSVKAICVLPPVPKVVSNGSVPIWFTVATVGMNTAAMAILPSGCKTASSAITFSSDNEIVIWPPWPKVGSSAPAAAYAGQARNISPKQNIAEQSVRRLSSFSIAPWTTPPHSD
jgi:hypothetical protein